MGQVCRCDEGSVDHLLDDPSLATTSPSPCVHFYKQPLLRPPPTALPQVRCRAVAALAALPAALGPGDTNAAPDVLRLLLRAAADGSGDMGKALQAEALPAVLGWLERSELLLTLLLPQARRGCGAGRGVCLHFVQRLRALTVETLPPACWPVSTPLCRCCPTWTGHNRWGRLRVCHESLSFIILTKSSPFRFVVPWFRFLMSCTRC